MTVNLMPLGGFGEVGRNSIAIEIDDEIVILDAGLNIEKYVEINNSLEKKGHLLRKLSKKGAIPDFRNLRKKHKRVKAIVCSHAHLDHTGAIPFIAKKFNCPIYSSHFTNEVIKSISTNDNLNLIDVKIGDKIKISKNFEIELIRVAHSTPQSSIIALHTPQGIILYANDYKNDQEHPFERPTDLERIKSLRGKVKILLLDSLYSKKEGRSESESVAREKILSLKEKIKDKELIVATTFSSHLARLRTLCDLADSMNRKIVFIGRSLNKYLSAGKDIEYYNLLDRGEVIYFPKQIERFLRKLSNKEDYFFIVAGHQGEPEAILHRLVYKFDYLSEKDLVIFSCNTIPIEVNFENRKKIESTLSTKKISFLKNIHVSGHAWSQDQIDLINLVKPQIFIPAHGDEEMMVYSVKLAKLAGLEENQIKKIYTNKKYVFWLSGPIMKFF